MTGSCHGISGRNVLAQPGKARGMSVRYDLHTHTTYSDGWDWTEMAAAAAEAGLEGIGFADHCPIGQDAYGRRERYDFAETYRDRREELHAAAGHTDIRLLDGAEVNYNREREDEIAAFLAEAEFEYTIGSVHFTNEFNFVNPDLAESPDDRRRAAVETYVDWQVALIESELFDIVSHLDLVQRSPQLRGLMERSHYARLAEALARSSTVPEINAGRLDRSYARIHPDPEWLGLFDARDIGFVVGSDAHAPDQLIERLSILEEELAVRSVRILDLPPRLD